ncbi:MAG: hypothetical protein GX632_11490, partial [Propioniciclava sp.]|nr:hypothetical protein [Propioniciclava sp.]
MSRRGLAAGVLALALVGCAQVQPGTGPTPTGPVDGPTAAVTAGPTPVASGATGTPSPSATAGVTTCADLAGSLDLRAQAAQLVMVGIHGELDAAEAAALEEYGFGSAILMGNTTHGVAGTRQRTDAVQAAGKGQVLVAVDQEGGLVRRLKGPGFTDM